MPIDKINSLKSVNFTNNETNNKINTTKTPEETEEGKEKLKKCLTALGVLAAAGIEIDRILRSIEDKQVIEKTTENKNEAAGNFVKTSQKAAGEQEAMEETEFHDKLKSDYQQRPNENLSLRERAANLSDETDYTYSVDYNKVKQLEENFSKEQIAVLNDDILTGILKKDENEQVMGRRTMDEMKKFTPKRLIELQNKYGGCLIIYITLSAHSQDADYSYQRFFREKRLNS